MAATRTMWFEIKGEKHLVPRQVWELAQRNLSKGWGHPTTLELLGYLEHQEAWGEIYRSTANDGYTVWHSC